MVKKKKRDFQIKKPFKLGTFSLISMAFFFFLSIASESFNLVILASFFSLLFFIATILSFVSIYYLGKKYKSKLVMKTVIVGFILYFAVFIFGSYYFSANYYEGYNNFSDTLLERESNLQQLIDQNMSQEIIASYEKETFNYFIEQGIPLLIPFIIIYLLFAIYSTFLGVGFIKLVKVRYSKAIGVMSIISVWLVPTIIGIFLAIPLMFATYILMILMFLDESKKAKE